MCGILAQVNFNTPINQLDFNTMRDTMTHRGPDGAGSEFFEHGKVGLGHRRLSIIDLSSSGKQPMCNEDETLWLTFNGEIYNYKELRQILQAKGHEFKSNSDSEVLIHGYEEWGTSLVDHLKGMFAFGIWDTKDKTLFLARDRFGIKPLCYYQDVNTFIIASELKAIVTASNVPSRLNPDALADYFVYRYIPSPKSIWQDIYKLPPAHCMLIEGDGSNKKWCYWTPEFGHKTISNKDAVEQLDHLLESSINEHLTSDVPVGLLLSGGMDSTTLAHYLNRRGLSPNTFSIGFKNLAKSEHEDAKLVAEEFNTIHHELMIENEFSGLVDKLAYFFDEPLGGTAFLPTYLVTKLASQHVKVILGGHGGDEVLAGYNWHHKLYADWNLKTLPIVKRWIQGDQKFLLNKAFKARAWTKWHYQDLNQLLNPDLLNKTNSKQDHDFFSTHYTPLNSPIKNAQSIDLSMFNNEFNLSFLDKASMANSVEGRVPLLDHKLVEWILSIDEKAYFKHGQNKNILKQLLKQQVPEQILQKPKNGFGFKIHRCLPLTQMKKEIMDSDCFIRSGIFNHTFIDQVFKSEHPAKIWSLYIFSKWFDHWNVKVRIEL